MSVLQTAVPAQGAVASGGPAVRRRLVALAIGLLVAALLGAGIAMLSTVPSTRAARTTYNAATPYRCGKVAPPAGITCWQGLDGTLSQLQITHNSLGLRQTLATVATASGSLSLVVEPAPALDCVTAGEPVVVRLSGGAVTTLFTAQGTLATAANPNIDADIAYQAGVTLVATALLVPCGLWLAALRRRRRGERSDVLETYRPQWMRLALLAFVAGQAADVVTSAIGQAVGLGEGNALVDVFIRAVGPIGFLLFRLPAIVLVLLGLSQVPRRIGAVALIGMGAIFVSVGVHNAVLAAGTGSVVCGSGVPLP